VGVVTIDLDLREHGKSDPEVHCAEVLDLQFRSGFLRTELITRETKDDESLILVRLIEGLEALILRRKTAFTGYVVVPLPLSTHNINGKKKVIMRVLYDVICYLIDLYRLFVAV